MDIYAYTNKRLAELMHDKGIRMASYDYVYTTECDIYPYPSTMEHTLRKNGMKVFPCYHLWNVLQWLRDHRDIHVVGIPNEDTDGFSAYRCEVMRCKTETGKYFTEHMDYFPSYEEAVENGILWVFKDLITNEKEKEK